MEHLLNADRRAERYRSSLKAGPLNLDHRRRHVLPFDVADTGRMMKLVVSSEGQLEVELNATAPLVYLDHCVISDLAHEKSQFGDSFRDALSFANGTLCLSWAHIVELFALGQGPTFRRIRAYLEQFGPRFLILDADPHAVIERERLWRPGRQHPAVDEDFIRFVGRNWEGRSEISLAILFDTSADADQIFQEMKPLHVRQKRDLKHLVDQERQRCKDDSTARNALNSARYGSSRPGLVTEKLLWGLMRECVRTNEQFTSSDALDFYHAVVSISYCDSVVLDKKWARRCREIASANDAAAVFDGTELEKVVKRLTVLREAER